MSRKEQKISESKMYEIMDKSLTDHHLGIRARGRSSGKHPRYYIMDYRGLGLATGIIRYTFEQNEEDVRIFYRGQQGDWEIKSGLYRWCKNKSEMLESDEWLKRVLENISGTFDIEENEREPDKREALAQHYGLKTRFLDVVDNIQTALWFAFDDTQKDNPRYDETVGYVHVLAIPEEKFKIIDLRTKSSEWLRPHVQEGFVVRHKIPDSERGSFAKYLVATFIISNENLRRWSNYDNLPHDYFYPSAELDTGAIYWNKAQEKLKKSHIKTEPPYEYRSQEKKNKKGSTSITCNSTFIERGESCKVEGILPEQTER